MWIIARGPGLVLLGICVGTVACSSTSGTGPGTETANPCATPGASYLESFVEQSGGTCGAIPSEVVNINPNGTLTTATPITCAKVTQTGCTAQDTDCTFSSMGYNFTNTFDVTFASDGSSASGVATITGSGNNQSCASTYNISFVRQ
jgi:hypothetical protein